MIGKTLLTSSTPTCTWMPQIIMLRPHHCVRSMSLWYRVLSVTLLVVPLRERVAARRRAARFRAGWCTVRTAAIASAMSSTAAATVSPMPLVTSTVLVSSSPVTV